MKISDRDKKLILIVVLAAVILLPVFLLIKPKAEEIETLKTQFEELEARYEYLKALQEKQPYYEEQIALLTEKRNQLLNGFAAGLTQQNSIMFLKQVEDILDISMTTETFNGISTTNVTEPSVDSEGNLVEGLSALDSTILVAYSGQYDNVKQLLDYFFTYDEKMIVPAIDMRYDSATGQISGTFTLRQFAITGNGGTFNEIEIPKINHGNESIFSEVKFVPEEDEEEEEIQEEVTDETVDEE